jgi:hypothetical protein
MMPLEYPYFRYIPHGIGRRGALGAAGRGARPGVGADGADGG